MLVQQGDNRSIAVDRRLACALASVAGALNAAAFYAVGFFAANMTGNVSTLSDQIAIGEFNSAIFYLSIVLTFIAGASAATLMITAGHVRKYNGIYALVILLEGTAIAILGVADLWLMPAWRKSVLVLGLAFLMGLQNAVVTRISQARVRTTHISGMATDIGIEVGLLLHAVTGRRSLVDSGEEVARLRLHVETILSFLSGGIVGVILYRAFGGVSLCACGFVLLIISLWGLYAARRS